jgi:membrane protein
MNAEIEHASPHGKAAGEKVPGRKKLVGARAAREFRRRHPMAPGGSRPAADGRPQARRGAALARAGVLAGGALAALFGRRARP